jgi:hypothetical protein
MRPSLILDVAELAIPNTASSSTEVENIIDRMKEWAGVVTRDAAVTVCLPSDSADTLWTLNCYPSDSNVEALLQMFELDRYFSARDVASTLNAILTRSISILEGLGVEVVSCEGSCLDEFRDAYPEALLADSVGCSIASLALAATIAPAKSGMVAFASSFLSAKQNSIGFSEQIQNWRAPDGSVESGPLDVDAEIEIVTTYEKFLEYLEPEQVWDESEDELQAHLAISLRAGRISGGISHTFSLPNFYFGGDFFESLISNQAGPKGRFGGATLESCARTVCGRPKNVVRPFGDASDGFTGHRTHITKQGVGLRLLFWLRPDAHVLFANVGPKSELWISVDRNGRPFGRSW